MQLLLDDLFTGTATETCHPFFLFSTSLLIITLSYQYIRRTLFVFAQWPNMHVSPFSFSAVLLTEKRAKIRPSLKFVYVVGVVRCLAEIKSAMPETCPFRFIRS